MNRLEQVMWSLDYLDDIASDLSAFHRVDDASELEASVFFKLVFRLPAYQGVLASRLSMEEGERTGSQGQSLQRTNDARLAQRSPVLTNIEMMSLNRELGDQWFSHSQVRGE